MNYYVYFLRSAKDGTTYVGMAKDVQVRLDEHNRGKSNYTKGHMPYQLVYQEGPYESAEARKREKYLKSTTGKNYLRKIGVLSD
jgi:putative endonuclease